MKIGSHVSIAKGLLGAAKEAHSYNANTFMVYTGAPQNTRRTPLEKLKIDEGKAYMKDNGISDIVIHAPYIINLASCKETTYELATDFLALELERTKAFGSEYLVLHPGAFTERDVDYGTTRIIDGINMCLKEDSPMICLETMAGKGTEIGRNFQELKNIIDGVNLKHKMGICFDTCHAHDSGYDIVNNFPQVLEEFDQIIGLDRLKVLHINGSLNAMGAKKDRHANIGADESNEKGKDFIGLKALKDIVNNEKLSDKIFILETPWISEKENLYKQEIEMLRG